MEAALNYNEKKVQKGQAVCLHAANYLKEAKEMNFYQKLNQFERLNCLNSRATTKTLHVSLNFDPSEKLPAGKLIDIASVYMEKIGFGEQPFLVYRHEDAGHPHIHIISNTIKEDGSRINTHNIGRNQSEQARKEIEQLYGLVKAERQQQLLQPGIKPVDVERVVYGKAETKRSISNVVSAVFSQYKFSSLPEFNAALNQFNVVADRGREEGRIYKNRGLVFRILDADGNKVGVPIKASSIGCRPTLVNLEKKFENNRDAKDKYKTGIKNEIDHCLQTQPATMKHFIDALAKGQIATILRQNVEGRIYVITYVDNKNKIVFNGSDLGKGYSVAAIQSRLGKNTGAIGLNTIDPSDGKTLTSKNKNADLNIHQEKEIALTQKQSLIDIIISPTEQFGNTAFHLLKKKRKKKRKNTNF